MEFRSWLRFVLFALALALALVCADEETSTRNSRWNMFSLFSLIRFTNEECATTSGRRGTCYRPDECTAIPGGKPSGPCAQGYGVCCLVEQRCNGTVTDNTTYFVSSDYPQSPSEISKASSCALKVPPSKDICQLRLDFETLDLNGILRDSSEQDGSCNGSSLVVSWDREGPENQGLPIVLCGGHAGQHLYVEVKDSTVPVVLAVTSPGRSKWSVKVTLIQCNSKYLAPQGCLQYFQEPEGELSRLRMSRNYAACFWRHPGTCSLIFRPLIPILGHQAELEVTQGLAITQVELENSMGIEAVTEILTSSGVPDYNEIGTDVTIDLEDNLENGTGTNHTQNGTGSMEVASTGTGRTEVGSVEVASSGSGNTENVNPIPSDPRLLCNWDGPSDVIQVSDRGLLCPGDFDDDNKTITVPSTSPWIVFFRSSPANQSPADKMWLIFEQDYCLLNAPRHKGF